MMTSGRCATNGFTAGEKTLAPLFALAANPAAARLDMLRMGRAHVCMSRATLERRYGT